MMIHNRHEDRILHDMHFDINKQRETVDQNVLGVGALISHTIELAAVGIIKAMFATSRIARHIDGD